MSATTTQDLEKLVIRLVGDGSDYNKTLDKAVRATEKAVRRIENTAKKMKTVGIGLSLAVTLPALGAVKAYASFDDAMTKSTAIMGNVSADLRKEMEATATSISNNSATSATDLAESYFFLASAGLDATASIAALPKVEKFAVAGAFNMATATDLLTDAQSALGMTSADSAENMMQMVKVSDLLVGANTLANASVEQFSSAITNGAGAAISKFNLDLEEGVAILGIYADQGLKGNAAGSSFSRAIRLTTQAINDNKGVFSDLNIEVDEFSNTGKNFRQVLDGITKATQGMGPAQKMATLQMLGFEAISQQAIIPLLGQTEAIVNYREKLQDMGGMTEKVASKQLKSFTAQIKILWNQIASISRLIGSVLAPHIAAITDKVKMLTTWFLGLSESTKRFVGIAVGLLAALGPVLLVLGTLVGLIPPLMAGFAAIGATGISTTLGAIVTPVLAIVAGFVALGFAIKTATDYIWGKGSFSTALSDAMATAKEFASRVVVFVQNIGHNFKVLMDWLPTNWHLLVTDMVVIFGTFVKNIGINSVTMVTTLFRLFMLFQGFMAQMFQRVFSVDMLKWIGKGIKNAADMFVKFHLAVWEGLKAIFTGGGGGQSLKDLAGKALKDVQEGFTTKDVLGSAANIIKDQAKLLRGPLEGFKSSIKKGPKFITEIEEEVKTQTDKSGLKDVAKTIEELQNNGGVDVKFTFTGVDAVLAGTAEAMSRLEEFRTLAGQSTASTNPTGATPGTIGKPRQAATRNTQNKNAQAGMLKVLEMIEKNTRASGENAITLAPAAV